MHLWEWMPGRMGWALERKVQGLEKKGGRWELEREAMGSLHLQGSRRRRGLEAGIWNMWSWGAWEKERQKATVNP